MSKWLGFPAERITEVIKRQFPELDAVIGGQISIDIYPKGNDKSQILEHIEKRENASEYIFFGDRTEVGENDYSIYQEMINRNQRVYRTIGWDNTRKFLKRL